MVASDSWGSDRKLLAQILEDQPSCVGRLEARLEATGDIRDGGRFNPPFTLACRSGELSAFETAECPDAIRGATRANRGERLCVAIIESCEITGTFRGGRPPHPSPLPRWGRGRRSLRRNVRRATPSPAPVGDREKAFGAGRTRTPGRCKYFRNYL